VDVDLVSPERCFLALPPLPDELNPPAVLLLIAQASMALGDSTDVVENVLPMHYGFEHHFDKLNICIIPTAADDKPFICTVSDLVFICMLMEAHQGSQCPFALPDPCFEPRHPGPQHLSRLQAAQMPKPPWGVAGAG
jgi:hypothetical protein